MVIGAATLFSMTSNKFLEIRSGPKDITVFFILYFLLILFPLKILNNFLNKRRLKKLLNYTKNHTSKEAVNFFV